MDGDRPRGELEIELNHVTRARPFDYPFAVGGPAWIEAPTRPMKRSVLGLTGPSRKWGSADLAHRRQFPGESETGEFD
ncbi:hypothetical protein NL676_022192 [Syzygium grande]|nr:hypothetical protein NL676_022192 [Syzygium grande]